MTATVAEAGVPLGPGSLKFGATGTEIDVSCNVNNAVIGAEKDEGDSVTKLCGTVVPGAISFTYTLSGNIDTDIGSDSGFFAMTQDQAGEQIDFVFVPNTDTGTSAAGKCVLVPLDFGGDETTATMASDFEFTVVDKPTYAYSGVAAAESEAVPA
jgi:hypothetical protein